MEKKLRFSEIIKKINEEQAKKNVVDPPHPVQAATDSTDNANTVKTFTNNNRTVSSENSDLPAQPHFDQSKNASDNGSQTINRPLETKAALAPASKNTAADKNPLVNTPREIPAAAPPAEEKTESLPERFFEDSGNDEESFDLYRYVDIILRRKNIVLAIILIMTVFSVFKYLTGSHYYTASARLLFKPNTQEILKDAQSSYTADYEKSFITHLELLKSHSVLAIVAQNLNERISPEIISEGLTIKQGETNGQKNQIIELSFKNVSAELSKDVLNELCKTYIEYRKDVNSQEISKLIFKFETQIDKLQKDLDEKESDLRLFKEENRMVQLSSETNLIVSKISDMELALQQAQLGLVETTQRISTLTSQISKQELDIIQSFTFNDPFQKKIADLELELNSLTTEYSAEHFKVKMLKQQIDNLKIAAVDSISREAESKTFIKNPIRQALLQDLLNLSVEKSALEQKVIAQEKIIELLNRDLLKLPSLEQKYAYLERETESILQTLRMLKSKYEEAKIKRDSQESDLKLLEMAQTPKKAFSKVSFSNIIIGIIIGLILGIALALLLEYLDQSLKDPRDVERELELPLLGVVPQIETNKVLLEHSSDLTKTALEPFRALRANLKHIATQNNAKTFIICSAIKGEGKTTLSANLAITFSLDNKKVILVDADLRRSQIHSLFSIDKKIGLSDYLLCKSSIDEIIKPTMYPNLSIVTAGERPDNPAELLGTNRFDLLLKEIRDKADYIIFDSPALLPVSDTITMAPKIDCCLMVVRTLWTPLKAACQAKNQLKRIGTRMFGGILNGIILSRGYYPYYYGYYGYSSYKYSYDDEHPHKFSFREFGLRIENNFKVFLKDLIFAIPRYVSSGKIAMTYICKRKFFWFLISLFLLLAAVLLWLENSPENISDDTIRYIGLGGISTSEKHALPTNSDMALPSAKYSGTQSATDPVNIKADTVDIIKTGLHDTIAQWANSISQRNLERYLSFYNQKTFKSANGSFPEWKRKAADRFTNANTAKINILRIETGKKGVSFIETIIYTTNNNGIRVNYDLVWQISTQGWKIVGEKTIQQEQ